MAHRIAAFRHGSVSGGVVIEYDSLDGLREQAARHLGLPPEQVGRIFNDEGVEIPDIRLLAHSTICYVAPVGVADFQRGSHVEDAAATSAQGFMAQLQLQLNLFMGSVPDSPCRQLIERFIRKALALMPDRFGLSGVGDRSGLTAVKVSELDDAAKGILAEMAVILEQYDAVSIACSESPGGARGFAAGPRAPIRMTWANELPSIDDLRARGAGGDGGGGDGGRRRQRVS
jgi:hypothetical protein